MMEKVTLGCQELQDSRVCQASQDFPDLRAQPALQDSLAFQEQWGLQDLRVTWVITWSDRKENGV